jgi:hypothetical protein
MIIQKRCCRLDFKTGSLKEYYFVGSIKWIDDMDPVVRIDYDYIMQRLWEISMVPRHLHGGR